MAKRVAKRGVKRLTLADVQAQIDEILAHVAKRNYDGAHGREDKLYIAVLGAIAAGHTLAPTPQTLARLALTTQAHEFPRDTA